MEKTNVSKKFAYHVMFAGITVIARGVFHPPPFPPRTILIKIDYATRIIEDKSKKGYTEEFCLD